MFSMGIRDRVRVWLGMVDLPSLTMFMAMEQTQRQRHEELMGAITVLRQSLQASHVMNPPQFSAPVLDWDTVQAIALSEMERNPQQEK